MTCTANFRYEEAGSVAFAADASKDGKGKGEGRQKKGQRDADKPVRGNGPQEPRGELASCNVKRGQHRPQNDGQGNRHSRKRPRLRPQCVHRLHAQSSGPNRRHRRCFCHRFLGSGKDQTPQAFTVSRTPPSWLQAGRTGDAKRTVKYVPLSVVYVQNLQDRRSAMLKRARVMPETGQETYVV